MALVNINSFTLSFNLQLPLLINKMVLLEEICKIRGVDLVYLNWILYFSMSFLNMQIKEV